MTTTGTYIPHSHTIADLVFVDPIRGQLTTDHSSSSYGIPVFVAADGAAYGAGSGVVRLDRPITEADHRQITEAGWEVIRAGRAVDAD